MTTLQVKLDLPDGLAKEANNLGLLEPQALQTMLREAVRRRHITRLTEARERIAKAQEERRSAIVRLGQSAAVAHASLVRARGEVQMLHEQVVPGAESVYEAVSEGYRLGKFGYMEVLDARRTLAAVRAQLVRAQTETQRAAADLQRLTAAPSGNVTNGEQQ